MSIELTEAIKNFNEPEYIAQHFGYEAAFWFNVMLMWRSQSLSSNKTGIFLKIKVFNNEIWAESLDARELRKLEPDIQIKWELSNVDKALLGE